MSNIKLSQKTDFACGYCNKILKEPIQLPCNALICTDHTKNLEENVFKCKSCNQEHIVPESGFLKAAKLQDLIDLDAFLTKNEKEHKKSLNSLFEKTCELFDDFNLKFNELEYFNHEHFAEMERQVELRRERLKYRLTNYQER